MQLFIFYTVVLLVLQYFLYHKHMGIISHTFRPLKKATSMFLSSHCSLMLKPVKHKVQKHSFVFLCERISTQQYRWRWESYSLVFHLQRSSKTTANSTITVRHTSRDRMRPGRERERLCKVKWDGNVVLYCDELNNTKCLVSILLICFDTYC